MSVRVEINQDLIKALDAIPLTLRSGPFYQCLWKYAGTIHRAVKPLARTSRGGSRRRWSRKYKNDPAFQNDSRDHFSVKVLKSGVAAYVGARYDQGNKQQFVMPYKNGDSYQRFLWGRPGQQVQRVSKRGKAYTTTVNTKPQTASFPVRERSVVRAFEITEAAANQAFLDELKRQLRSLKLG